tara:strand:+ start:1111 stop:1308 length:198 start_codon:yes stop_codon:yes gene_type:complete
LITGGNWTTSSTSTFPDESGPIQLNSVEAHEVGEVFESDNPLETGYGEREISRGEKKLRKAKRGW